jgi:hypothetical protein
VADFSHSHRAIAFGVGHMDGRLGLEGWRWLFIVEGVPSSELSNLLLLKPVMSSPL